MAFVVTLVVVMVMPVEYGGATIKNLPSVVEPCMYSVYISTCIIRVANRAYEELLNKWVLIYSVLGLGLLILSGYSVILTVVIAVGVEAAFTLVERKRHGPYAKTRFSG